jgi:hypothetical protein
MSPELRRDIPLLLLIVSSFALFFLVPALADTVASKRFRRAHLLVLCTALPVLLVVGVVIAVVSIPGSRQLVMYLALLVTSIGYFFGCVATWHVRRTLAWRAKDASTLGWWTRLQVFGLLRTLALGVAIGIGAAAYWVLGG